MNTITASRIKTTIFGGSRTNKLIALGVIAIVIIAGTLLVMARAAGFFAAVDPTTGTVTANAKIITDSTAFGGKAIEFTAPASGGGTGSGTALLNLPRVPWDGGPAYYSQFPIANAAGWDDPSFFPISVFFGKPSHATALKNVGINTYMGAEHDGSPISMMTGQGMYVLAQSEWTRAEVGNDGRVVGWHVSDECDMGYSGCTPDWNNDNGEYGRLDVQKKYVSALRAYNDGRFLQANFGNGILRTWWAQNTMDDHVKLVDLTSADKYTYTSPHVWDITQISPDWPQGATVSTAASYGWQHDQMMRFQEAGKIRPNWVFVETARPYLTEAGALTIKPEQMEGAVWSGIIHGARGIAYFQHNNDGQCGTYSLVDCSQALKDKATTVHAKIRSLAPVLNTQSYQYNFNNGTDTMLKAHNGSAYIFAGIGLKQSTGSKTFKLPAGVNGTTVTVVGEGRTLTVSNGSFTDTFANEYTHHVYQIAL